MECTNTTNATLCMQILKSDPRSAGADLRGLGLVAVDKALEAQADLSDRIIRTVNETAENPRLQDHLKVCNTDNVEAYEFLRDCQSSWNSNDYVKMEEAAVKGSQSHRHCYDEMCSDELKPDICDVVREVAFHDDLAKVIASDLAKSGH